MKRNCGVVMFCRYSTQRRNEATLQSLNGNRRPATMSLSERRATEEVWAASLDTCCCFLTARSGGGGERGRAVSSLSAFTQCAAHCRQSLYPCCYPQYRPLSRSPVSDITWIRAVYGVCAVSVHRRRVWDRVHRDFEVEPRSKLLLIM